jgi:hypothetical protein
MSRIKAFNMGLSYCITPLVSLPRWGGGGRKSDAALLLGAAVCLSGLCCELAVLLL